MEAPIERVLGKRCVLKNSYSYQLPGEIAVKKLEKYLLRALVLVTLQASTLQLHQK